MSIERVEIEKIRKVVQSGIFWTVLAALIGAFAGAYIADTMAKSRSAANDRKELGYRLVACYCESREWLDVFADHWGPERIDQRDVATMFEFPTLVALAESPGLYEHLDHVDAAIRVQGMVPAVIINFLRQLAERQEQPIIIQMPGLLVLLPI